MRVIMRVILSVIIFVISESFTDENNIDQEANLISNSMDLLNTSKNITKILCIGDSITQGYGEGYTEIHPYTLKLQELLQQNGYNAQVVNRGKGGERVHKEMINRLKEELDNEKYDLALIMGGTNDLVTLDCIRNVDLFHDIKAMHALAHRYGVKTVAMTILEAYLPENKLKFVNLAEFQKLRNRVNQKIRKELSNVCDTAAKFPYARLSMQLKEQLWCIDRVHPSPIGYDRLGEIIFECISGDL